jgi:hypothetical protein
MNLLLLPIFVLKFWYLEAPFKLIKYFIHLNKLFMHIFSLPLMIRTFFRPWKNEYREGLVLFSIFMGMAFKSMFIIADLIVFTFLLIVEAATLVVFLIWPVITVYFAFIKI